MKRMLNKMFMQMLCSNTKLVEGITSSQTKECGLDKKAMEENLQLRTSIKFEISSCYIMFGQS
jgi:hypothetical protein